ncbi:VanZ family protein [Microbacterium testaceum]|uniref:VanZ family protein n=1 Tax=Microbacterium testaceum TaxID=2033 RepID=A0A2T7WI63_MICTE|nr:VanZ family protein [Microbacterium testaceum]PVE72146.1 VanZ family protein [Microbacterium testaceum]
MTKRRRAGLVAASCVYAFAVWWMTLRPSIYDAEVGGILGEVLRLLAASPATAWVSFDVVESAANVAMFVPLGLLVAAWGGRWWQGLVLAAALSTAIELTQLWFLPTRVADVRDVVANTAGAGIGLLVAAGWRRWRRSSQQSHNARHRKLIDTGAQ